MRIAFAGAQSTGKTTLLKELQKNSKLTKKFTFVESFVRNLKKRRGGLSNNSEDTQWEIIQTHIDNLQKDDIIMDRCLLDSVVYTRYYASQGVVSGKSVLAAYRALMKYRNKLDVVFYLRPEFGVVEDGERSPSATQQMEVTKLFDKLTRYLPKVVILQGTVEERVSQVITTLKEMGVDC